MTSFVNNNGNRLQMYFFRASKPVATMVYFHSFGSHAMFELQFAKDVFLSKGINVASFDYVGHGRSDGKRFYIDYYEKYIRDANKFVSIVKNTPHFGNYPMVVIGSASGGAIASKVLETSKDIRRGYLMIPLYKPGDIHDTFVKRMFRKMISVVSDRIPVLDYVKTIQKTMDHKTLVAWNSDPLVMRGKLCLRTLREILKLSESALNGIDNIKIHTTCIQSTCNKQVDAMLNITLFSSDHLRSLIITPKSLHGILTDNDRDQIIDRVANEICVRCTKKQAKPVNIIKVL